MNKLTTVALSLLLTAFIGAPAVAKAQISVDRVILNFKSGQRPVQNIVVKNSGKETLGIEILPDVMIRPGEENQERVPATDLVASPKRFSIPGEGQRTVRILLKKPLGDVERVYRIKVMPKPKGFADEPEKKATDTTTQLKIITTVGLLVFAEPKVPQPVLSWEKNGSMVTFKNEGNVNIFLDEGKSCASEATSCVALPANRVYPGNEWKVDVGTGAHIVYRKRAPNGVEGITIQ